MFNAARRRVLGGSGGEQSAVDEGGGDGRWWHELEQDVAPPPNAVYQTSHPRPGHATQFTLQTGNQTPAQLDQHGNPPRPGLVWHGKLATLQASGNKP